MANVKLENVYKIYPNGAKAVKDFSLDIQNEEFVVFVGPSGCGKSTTLRMIAGLEDITAGKIYIDNVLVNDLEPKDRDISMVFQNYALYPNMTVFENMAYGLRCHHVKEDEIKETINTTAEILGITDYLNRKPKELSGGQRQRVALGRAIVRKPKVFLLDEPLSNLDAKLHVQMRSEISKLHKKLKTTFIYVTHDQTEAMTMGSKIVVMKDGIIQQVDIPLNLYNHPVNTFVATFLGSPQMNLLEGKIIKRKDEFYFVSGDLEVLINESMLLQMKNYKEDMDVYLGIRPSDISLSNEGYKTKVELIEQLGNETILYINLPGKEDMSIVSSTEKNLRIINGDEINLNFDLNHIHLFDKETGLSLVQTNVVNEIDGVLYDAFGRTCLNDLVINDERKSHFIKDDLKNITIKISSDDISFNPIDDSISEEVKIKKIVKYLSYDVVFATLNNDKPIVIKTTKNDLKEGKFVKVYIPFEKAEYYKDNEKVYSKLLSKDTKCLDVNYKKTRSSIILTLPKGIKSKEKQYLVEKREEINDVLILKLLGNKSKDTLFVKLGLVYLFEGQFVFIK